MNLDPRQNALLELGRGLERAGYDFVTPTPETHRRVVSRPTPNQPDLRDIFGWSREFKPSAIAPELLRALEAAEAVIRVPSGALRSRVRFSRLEGDLFVHSAYPTVEADCVFFGPDTYRFARFLQGVGIAGGIVVDLGTGSGAGGLSVRDRADSVVFTDINSTALRYAQVNAALSGMGADRARFTLGDGLASVDEDVDWIISNPPFLTDPGKRAYRDGGDLLGAALSLRWISESMTKLRKGGALAMYTASAIVDGVDGLKARAVALARDAGATIDYAELDPDIFGEEIETEAYSRADRIAAVGMVLRRS